MSKVGTISTISYPGKLVNFSEIQVFSYSSYIYFRYDRSYIYLLYSRVPNKRPWLRIYFGKKFTPGRTYLGPVVYLISRHLAAWAFIKQ